MNVIIKISIITLTCLQLTNLHLVNKLYFTNISSKYSIHLDLFSRKTMNILYRIILYEVYGWNLVWQAWLRHHSGCYAFYLLEIQSGHLIPWENDRGGGAFDEKWAGRGADGKKSEFWAGVPEKKKGGGAVVWRKNCAGLGVWTPGVGGPDPPVLPHHAVARTVLIKSRNLPWHDLLVCNKLCVIMILYKSLIPFRSLWLHKRAVDPIPVVRFTSCWWGHNDLNLGIKSFNQFHASIVYCFILHFHQSAGLPDVFLLP